LQKGFEGLECPTVTGFYVAFRLSPPLPATSSGNAAMRRSMRDRGHWSACRVGRAATRRWPTGRLSGERVRPKHLRTVRGRCQATRAEHEWEKPFEIQNFKFKTNANSMARLFHSLNFEFGILNSGFGISNPESLPDPSPNPRRPTAPWRGAARIAPSPRRG
jgi:hypothetical protein